MPCLQCPNIVYLTFFLYISERKVQPDEYPHSLYIANYSTAAATCLIVKRWLFDLETEKAVYSDRVALEFLFQYVSYMN